MTTTGADRIAAERRRQIDELGRTPQHDADHADGQLLDAAYCYLRAAQVVAAAPESQAALRRFCERRGINLDGDEDYEQMVANPARHHFGWNRAPDEWPWSAEAWNPSPDAARNLEKAGALIAAELDRLAAAPRTVEDAGTAAVKE